MIPENAIRIKIKPVIEDISKLTGKQIDGEAFIPVIFKYFNNMETCDIRRVFDEIFKADEPITPQKFFKFATSIFINKQQNQTRSGMTLEEFCRAEFTKKREIKTSEDFLKFRDIYREAYYMQVSGKSITEIENFVKTNIFNLK